MVTASAIAAACGVHYKAVVCLARAGAVPHAVVDGEMRFDAEATIAAVRARNEVKRCSRCGNVRPLGEFRKRRHRSGAEGPSSECNDCHKRNKELLRRKNAEARGKLYRTREEARRAQRERTFKRQADRQARKAERLAHPSKRAAELYRERYHNDPRFREREKARRSEAHRKRREAAGREKRAAAGSAQAQENKRAKRRTMKLKRERLIRGTRCENVKHQEIAERDGWKCAICGGKVTRRNWSLDHIVPLSAGGAHSYANCALAHRVCNSRRGAGRLASQPPLFSRLEGGGHTVGPSTGRAGYGCAEARVSPTASMKKACHCEPCR